MGTFFVCLLSMFMGFFCAAAFALTYEKDLRTQLADSLDRVRLLELQLSNETLQARQMKRELVSALAHLSGAPAKDGE